MLGLVNLLINVEKFNPKAVEKSVWSANGTDKVITFLCQSNEGSLTKETVGALDLLSKVKLVQENWVIPGTDIKRCAQPWLKHNVSNTINIKPGEWKAVENYIYKNRAFFTGVSLLGHSGDKDYAQAPFQKVMTMEEIHKVYGAGALYASDPIVHAHTAFGNLYRACSAILGRDEDIETLQKEWGTSEKINKSIDLLEKQEIPKYWTVRKVFLDYICQFSRVDQKTILHYLFNFAILPAQRGARAGLDLPGGDPRALDPQGGLPRLLRLRQGQLRAREALPERQVWFRLRRL